MSVPDFQRRFLKEEVQMALIEFLRERRVLHPWGKDSDFARVQMIPGSDGSIFLGLWRKP